MNRAQYLMVAVLATLLWFGNAFAEVPGTMTYQGRLNDASGNPVNTAVWIVFSLYPASNGGSSLWNEGRWVTVQNGVFNVALGSSNPFYSSLFSLSDLYLGIQVNSDAEMTPRQKVNSGAFAMKSGTADAVENAAGTITAIPDGAVTTTKIGDGAVTTTKIAESAATNPKIASVSSAKVTGAFADTSLSSNVALLNNDQTISGTKTFNAPVISNVPTRTLIFGGFYSGAAPLQVASQTVVENLNADLLNGQHAGDIIAAAADEKRTPISSLPYTITASGSYYLTQNRTASGNGIVVNADNVTIDLNGFTITGDGTGDCINIINYVSNVEIKNGTVTDCYNGISGHAASAGPWLGHKVTSVRSIHNAHDGMQFIAGENIITNCFVSNNGGNGIYLPAGGNAVIDTYSWWNALYGIAMGEMSKAVNNTASGNGYKGIVVGDYSIAAGNRVSLNSESGIKAGQGSLITGNIASRNSMSGIQTGVACTIRDNTANQNSLTGIDLQNYSLLVHNTAYGNKQLGQANTYNISPANWCLDPFGAFCSDYGVIGCVYVGNAAPFP